MKPEWCPKGFVVAPAKTRRERREPLPADPLPAEDAANAGTDTPRSSRVVRRKDDLGVDADTLLEAVLRDPATYALAEVLPAPDLALASPFHRSPGDRPDASAKAVGGRSSPLAAAVPFPGGVNGQRLVQIAA